MTVEVLHPSAPVKQPSPYARAERKVYTTGADGCISTEILVPATLETARIRSREFAKPSINPGANAGSRMSTDKSGTVPGGREPSGNHTNSRDKDGDT